MAAKLTFEAKMQGMEQVLDLLKRAEERMNDFGRVGSYSLEGVDRRLKEFQSSLEFINKSQSGMGGIFKSFDELNRQSNQFLGKSYRGIIDGMKQDVKAFETEADRIMNKVKEIDAAQEALKSKRSAMSEQSYQEQQAQHTKEIDALKSQGVAVATEKIALQKQLFYAQPLSQGIHDFASKYGMGEYATVGGSMVAGAYAAGIPGLIARGGMAVGGYGMQMNFTRDADAYLAQSRLQRTAAGQAMNFDPTTFMLQSMNGGIEKPGMESWSMWAKSRGQYLWDNPFVRGAATASAVFTGLTASTLGVGAPAAAWLAGGAGVAAFSSAGNRTLAQIEAENRGELRNRDLEMYGILGRGAAAQTQRESTELGAFQRIYGIEGTHNLSMQAAFQGMAPDRANPMMNMMLSQGLLPTNFMGNSVSGFDMGPANLTMQRMSMSPTVQAAIMRATALNGGSLIGNTNNAIGLFAGAGLTSRGDIASRGALGDYAAGLANNRGAGFDMGSAGAGVAANVSANAPGFNKVEGVQQGITNFESQNKLMQGGSSAMDTILISKLRQLGVMNAAAIDAFIKLDPTLPRTQAQIAAYTGKSIEEVQKAMGSVAGAYKNMFETVLGKDQMDKFNKATGGDMMTLFTSGTKAFDNTTQGGATFSEGMSRRFSGGGTGDASSVAQGAESFADKQNAAAATQTLTIDEKMREILAGTGKTVTDEITKAIIKGFEVTSEEVRKAGDKIISDKGGSPVGDIGGVGNVTKPYMGPKENKEPQ